jgi:hypothetical protein
MNKVNNVTTLQKGEELVILIMIIFVMMLIIAQMILIPTRLISIKMELEIGVMIV